MRLSPTCPMTRLLLTTTAALMVVPMPVLSRSNSAIATSSMYVAAWIAPSSRRHARALVEGPLGAPGWSTCRLTMPWMASTASLLATSPAAWAAHAIGHET